MATLNGAQKKFILERLACYDTSKEVIEAVRETFGVEVTSDQVAYYDPSNVKGRGLGKKWREYFEEVRNRFLKQVEDIPIANRSYRLRQLQKMAQDAFDRKNYGLAKDLYEQAAKEVGEAYTNTKHVDVTSGGETITGVVFTQPGAGEK